MLGWLGRSLLLSKCVLMSTSAAIRRDMKDWVVFSQDEHWTVKLDVRDLGGHLDTTYRALGCTLAAGLLLFFGLSGWSLLYRLAIVVSFVFFAPCMSLLLYMVLKHLIFLWVVFFKLRAAFVRACCGLVS